jgi:undecaprenyl-diphosphatase
MSGAMATPADHSPRALLYPVAFVAILALGLVFGFAAREARQEEPDGPDRAAGAWLAAERARFPGVTAALRVATGLGDVPWSLLACGAVAVALAALGRRGVLPRGLHEGTFWLVVLGTGWGLNALLKLAFRRERPPLDGRLVAVGEQSFSFPSGHAAFAGVFFGLLGLILYRYAGRGRWPGVALCALGAIAVAGSRVWLGVHYLSDVVGGLAVGLSWAVAAWAVRHRSPLRQRADLSTRPGSSAPSPSAGEAGEAGRSG